MRVLHETFRATFKSWGKLFLEATDFATELDPQALISISHSCDNENGVVTVWYRGNPDECPKCDYNLTGNVSGQCPECGTKV